MHVIPNVKVAGSTVSLTLTAIALYCMSLGVPVSAQGTPEPTSKAGPGNPLLASTPTPDPLGKALAYWDMGLLIRYPADWGEPQFTVSQVAMAPPNSITANGDVTRAIIALRVVDPVRDFGLPKDAEFGLIALYANFGSTTSQVSPGENGTTTVGGLEAGYINVRDPQRDVIGQTIAFMLPDGRHGVLAGAAKSTYWPEFAPIFDAIRGSINLMKPDGYKIPELATTKTSFQPGGVELAFPEGWRTEPFGTNAQLYYDPGLAEYRDNSGFRNGPQLIIRAESLKSGVSLRDALIGMIGDPGADPVTEITVGGRPAVQHQSTMLKTGQVVTFIGFASGDGKLFNVIRWTVPGMLVDVTRPSLDAILASVEY